MEIAYFAGGCFWGIEYEFQRIKGVIDTEVGFMGGHVKNPTYKEVYTDNTGHAETVKVIYDENIVTYRELLEEFFKMHDPTSLNKQGKDNGTRYRSEIFYTNENQKKEANEFIRYIEDIKLYSKKIVTKISKANDFYPAEEYHQNYKVKIYKKKRFLHRTFRITVILITFFLLVFIKLYLS
ncbi:peptide-methionine (S)-S-oxide reductase [Hypnocyclicus thermotrophus]|uniref:Peptide methionine sulfoxide reductase MsrA n=1 Tax=Hypnocyclicus thermotrophus TaxID=1627895 RepID=A0AA46DY90_9FUSO|nr:peptide-methionine (S)-S-oxide reductase MsrA [Hypnocyclicus thermotrophus]TDT69803.1 peptide-methionine (S)-S-oxide reductase [Hypnocyclicus thermotrophus]